MAKPTSDTFGGAVLDAKWTAALDAKALASIALTGVGQLRLTLPAGASVGYDRTTLNAWDGPWIYQPTAIASSAADDFNVRLRCNSAFTNGAAGSGEQSWGMVFHNTNTEFLAFFVVKEEAGTVRARWITNVGSLNNTVNVTLSDYAPNYQIRVTRTWNSGNNSTYTMFTSPDGTTWTQRGAPTAKTAAGLRPGIYAANRGGATSVAFAPEFELYEEAADPLPILSTARRRVFVMGGAV